MEAAAAASEKDLPAIPGEDARRDGRSVGAGALGDPDRLAHPAGVGPGIVAEEGQVIAVGCEGGTVDGHGEAEVLAQGHGSHVGEVFPDEG